ncbi:MAG: hypothetical protein ABR526_05100 [Chthoniobacterales bacterium]
MPLAPYRSPFGTPLALEFSVNLYDLAADDVVTPVTGEQISELFEAGRLQGQDPCKLAQSRTWRTVDELFPLLKYGVSPAVEARQSPPRPKRNASIVPLAAVVMIGCGLAYVLALERSPGASERSSLDKTVAASYAAVAPQLLNNSTGASALQQAAPSRPWLPSTPVLPSSPPQSLSSQPSDRGDSQSEYNARAANYNAAMEMKRRAEQAAAEKGAAAQRWRADLEKRQADIEKREAEERRLAGIDWVVPLDRFAPVDLGGSPVQVRIHDSNIMTFDAWVNGTVHKNVVKQKGISHTGADETLIYRNGRASLYYVWELSGKLNHCLLRVREQ